MGSDIDDCVPFHESAHFVSLENYIIRAISLGFTKLYRESPAPGSIRTAVECCVDFSIPAESFLLRVYFTPKPATVARMPQVPEVQPIDDNIGREVDWLGLMKIEDVTEDDGPITLRYSQVKPLRTVQDFIVSSM